MLKLEDQLDKLNLKQILDKPVTYTQYGTLGKYFECDEILLDNPLRKDPLNQKGLYSVKV